VNWEEVNGPVECAAECQANDDCETGCCQQLSNGTKACAPAGYCDAGGAIPEEFCAKADECDFIEDEAACVRDMTACVDRLSSEQQLEWINRMSACGDPDSRTCDQYLNCWAGVPWC
jgi:hypothetical protein